ncbi:MAG: nucleoside deaminase [Oscillospiraceae bacterium]|nr:nucleoside deaminase [Oscillospiraceae bacterium]
MYNEIFMKEALLQGKLALEKNEVPVGAVIVKDGNIIAKAHNDRELSKNALHHAEILAIDKACKILGGWRLWQCEMYVTMEPCPMCAGAIVNARIPQIYFGAYDNKYGACGSEIDVLKMKNNFNVEYSGGYLEEESLKLFDEFFRYLRGKNNKK